jgi:hypothetical protein
VGRGCARLMRALISSIRKILAAQKGEVLARQWYPVRSHKTEWAMPDFLSGSLTTLLGAAAGGTIGFLASRHFQRIQTAHAEYDHADTLYADVVRLYLEYPRFGDLRLTSDFEHSFDGNEASQYGFFAMNVHSFLETLYDSFYLEQGHSIAPQWARIFDYHARLHVAWLLANPDANEPTYRRFALSRGSSTARTST